MTEDIWINIGVSALLAVLNDPTKRGRWRKAILKIFRVAALSFQNDEDFRNVARSMEKE